MAFTVYALVKLLHVLLATTWVGAVIYDRLFNLRRFLRPGGAAGLRAYVEETGPTIPFWATVGFGTLIFGFETARRFFGSANPLAWLDAGGSYIFVGFLLVIVSLALGIAQVPPRAKAVAEAGDEKGSAAILARIKLLGTIEVALLVAVVVLMVGSGVGGY